MRYTNSVSKEILISLSSILLNLSIMCSSNQAKSRMLNKILEAKIKVNTTNHAHSSIDYDCDQQTLDVNQLKFSHLSRK